MKTFVLILKFFCVLCFVFNEGIIFHRDTPNNFTQLYVNSYIKCNNVTGNILIESLETVSLVIHIWWFHYLILDDEEEKHKHTRIQTIFSIKYSKCLPKIAIFEILKFCPGIIHFVNLLIRRSDFYWMEVNIIINLKLHVVVKAGHPFTQYCSKRLLPVLLNLKTDILQQPSLLLMFPFLKHLCTFQWMSIFLE